jgi:hypothetical protein
MCQRRKSPTLLPEAWEPNQRVRRNPGSFVFPDNLGMVKVEHLDVHQVLRLFREQSEKAQ